MSVDITDNPERDRYEAHVDGELAGFTEYDRHEEFTVLPHTEVGKQFRGLGVADALTRHAVEDIHAQGRQVYPLCPFVVKWLGKHPEYDEFVHKP